MSNELGMELTKQEFKFDYSFTALVFATLALSIQFSPPMGNETQWLLMLSWFFLLVSAILGGLRIINKVYFLHINVVRNEATKNGNVKYVDTANQIMLKTDKKALLFFKFQQWFFLIGVICNLVFAANNYLE